jgi:hypothetical protein
MLHMKQIIPTATCTNTPLKRVVLLPSLGNITKKNGTIAIINYYTELLNLQSI